MALHYVRLRCPWTEWPQRVQCMLALPSSDEWCHSLKINAICRQRTAVMLCNCCTYVRGISSVGMAVEGRYHRSVGMCGGLQLRKFLSHKLSNVFWKTRNYVRMYTQYLHQGVTVPHQGVKVPHQGGTIPPPRCYSTSPRCYSTSPRCYSTSPRC